MSVPSSCLDFHRLLNRGTEREQCLSETSIPSFLLLLFLLLVIPEHSLLIPAPRSRFHSLYSRHSSSSFSVILGFA
ncbi:hypothetical protein VNO80_24387 [Phaseolus coccineus]|uniref:Uncharacterized protein n=1 Tax=Phaseolus coccineus TaxID=3886 RepID=A0AAN9LSQ1_PHACN